MGWSEKRYREGKSKKIKREMGKKPRIEVNRNRSKQEGRRKHKHTRMRKKEERKWGGENMEKRKKLQKRVGFAMVSVNVQKRRKE